MKTQEFNCYLCHHYSNLCPKHFVEKKIVKYLLIQYALHQQALHISYIYV